MGCFSSCKLLYCLSESSKLGLQPTIWVGQPDNEGTGVSLTRLLTTNTSSKPQTPKPFLHCKIKLNSEGWRHLAGEIRRTLAGTNRPGSCLASQYPQGAKEPQRKGVSGLTFWLAHQTCHRTRYYLVLLNTHQGKPPRHSSCVLSLFSSQQRIYLQGS